MKKITGLCILLLALCVSIIAQTKNKSTSVSSINKPALFSGHVKRITSTKDSIRIVFIKDFMSNVIRQFPIVSVPVDEKGDFRFKLDDISQPGKIVLYYINGATTSLGDYISEAGDDIQLSVSFKGDQPKVVFSGMGAEKYKARQKIGMERDLFNYKRDNSAPLYAKKDIESLFLMHQAASVSMLRALDQYKSKLSPEIYQYLKGEFISYPFAIWCVTLSEMFDKNTNTKGKLTFLKYLNDLNMVTNEEEIAGLAQAHSYIGYILEKEKTVLRLSRNGEKVDFRKMYERLKSTYNGVLREHLLASHLLETYRQLNLSFADPLDFEYCLKDAYNLVQTPLIKEEINKSIKRNARGSIVYNFSLPDTTGTMRTLSEFKGKVVMLDMWNTGCTGCAIFARYFKEKVYPEFKDNPDFAVISVNTDKKRDQWMKSLYGGRYTQPDHVNLNIGNEQDDPFLNYYQVVAYPFLLLIDKQGRVYAPLTIHTMDKLSVMIREALNKP